MKNITNQLPFDNSLDGGSISIPRGWIYICLLVAASTGVSVDIIQ
jgi:hypothetical protein